MVRVERRPGVESRIGTAYTKEKIRGSLNPDRIAVYLGGSIEKLKPVSVRSVDTHEVLHTIERWKISIANKELGFVTDIYIDPKSREVSIQRQKGAFLNSDKLNLPFPGQDESFVSIRRVNRAEYLDGRVKFVKRGRESTAGIDVWASGKVELKGDPRLFLLGRKETESTEYFIDPEGLK